MTVEDAVQRFASVARPEMLRWFTPQSCIHSTAVTVLAFQELGFRARALSVSMVVQNPSTNRAYVSGLDAETKRRAIETCSNWIDKGDPKSEGGGWEGHLVAVAEDEWWLDASLDQARLVADIPSAVFAFRFGRDHGPAEEIATDIELSLDDGTLIKLSYRPRPDNVGYLKTEAWKDEANPVVAHRIAAMMLGMPVSSKLEFFTIYDHPRDYPDSYVVRRWVLDPDSKEWLPDRLLWSQFRTAEQLDQMRDDFIRSGRVKIMEPPQGDKNILEVWL